MRSTDEHLHWLYDIAMNPATSPSAALVTITQNAVDTEVYGMVKTGYGVTEDPKIMLVATVRIADLPMRPSERDTLRSGTDFYSVANVIFDDHGHAKLLCRVIRGAGPRT